MDYMTLNNGVKMPMMGIGTFMLSPDEAEACEVKPAILQTEVHPCAQAKELKDFLSKENMIIQAWYPLGHGDAALI